MSQVMKATKPSCHTAKKAAGVVPFKPVSASLAKPCILPASASAQQYASPVQSRCQSLVTKAAAAEQAPATSSTEKKEWYAIVCNSEFFFRDPQNESIPEQLRERTRFFQEKGRPVDFYIVPDPKWLDAKFPQQAKQVKRPCVALVSTDPSWITFMKLRIDRVLKVDLGSMPAEEALAMGGQVPVYPLPDKWTAPYARYTPGWWEVFLPKH